MKGSEKAAFILHLQQFKIKTKENRRLSYLEMTFASFQFICFHSVSVCVMHVCTCVRVWMCTCVYVCMHACACTCMWILEAHSRGFSLSGSPPMFLRQGLSLNLALLIWLDWLAKKLLVSDVPHSEVTDSCHCACFYVAFTGLNSGPCVCSTSTLSNKPYLMSSPWWFFLLSKILMHDGRL